MDKGSTVHGRKKEEIHGKRIDVSEDKSQANEESFESNMSIDLVKKRMQRLQQDVLEQVNDRLNEMVTEVVEGMGNITNCGTPQKDETNKLYIDKKRREQNGKLPEKVFQTRNSVLTDLLQEVKHMKAIYNVWGAILWGLFVHTLLHDFIQTGRPNFGLGTIAAGFGKFPIVIQFWCTMTLSTFCIYAVHSFWAHQRIKFKPNSLLVRIWDFTWGTTFVLYQLAFLIIIAKAVLVAELPPPSALIVLLEQVRMIMKIHAFVRSTWPVATSYKPHTEGKEFKFPGFSKFLYFMFAPTLVYRDSYPRTRTIRWNVVLWHFTEVLLIIFFVAFLCERFIYPSFKDFGLQPISIHDVILATFNTTIPGFAFFLCGFYCLLHAWLNAWAELMTFGDRMFYKDWWNATAFPVYYRNWNVVVHDWLYTYMYKDLHDMVFPGYKFIATYMVFAASAIVHEYILSIAFRLFLPLMLIQFGGFGYSFIYILRKTSNSFGNIFLWWGLTWGSGMLVSCYAIEFFARINCPIDGNEFWDLIVPRTLACLSN